MGWAAYKQVDYLKEKVKRLERQKQTLLRVCRKADILFAHAVGSVSSADPTNAERNFQEAKKILDQCRRVVKSTEGRV